MSTRTFHPFPLEAPLRIPGWKRGLDIFCCVLALPLLALATFVIAFIMSISSPGPIFFRQERVGHMGRRFKLYKFRTMHVGADSAPHQAHFKELIKSKAPMEKLDARGEHRLIAGGWLLRTSGLDELPQILNVLRGEMSIVGPRPCIPYEYEQYSADQRQRFRTVPGLTGLWQVSGKNRTTFDRMIELDVAYAERKSLWLDCAIILRTPLSIGVQIFDTWRARRQRRRAAAVAAPLPSPAPVPLEARPDSRVSS